MYLAVFLLMVAAAVGAAFLRDLSAARARLVGRSEIVPTPFGNEEYASLGKGDPVLVVHGAGGGFDQGLGMTRPLADHGYRLIAPSRFGYLGSASPGNLTTAMQADAYAHLLDRLGIDKVAVIGISAGAWSSIEFAIRHPERCRALVLLVPADYLPEGISNHGGVVATAIFNSDFAAWAALKLMPIVPGGMTRMVLGTDETVLRMAGPSEKARVQQVLDHLLPISSRRLGMQFDISTAAARVPQPLERIGCPVLAISAEDDRFGTAARAKLIAAAAPGGRAIIYEAGGHALVARYEDTLRAVVEFVAEQVGGSGADSRA